MKKYGESAKYYSASQLSLFEKCSQAFYIKYCDRMLSGTKDRTTEKMLLGKAIHTAMEMEFFGKDRKETFLKYILEHNIGHLATQGLEMLKDARGVNENTISVEQEFYILIDRITKNVSLKDKYYVAGCDEIILKGYIDRIDEKEDEIEIVDYKSGEFENVSNMRSNIQLGIYALYANLMSKKTIKMTIEKLWTKEEFSEIFDKDDTDKTIDRVITIVKRIETEEPSANERACRYCYVKSNCLEKQVMRYPQRQATNEFVESNEEVYAFTKAEIIKAALDITRAV